jgi:hypothetical protein
VPSWSLIHEAATLGVHRSPIPPCP